MLLDIPLKVVPVEDPVLDTDTVASSYAVEIRGLSPTTSEQMLTLFFENRKRSGGGPIAEIIVKPEDRCAVITFESAEGKLVIIKKIFKNIEYEHQQNNFIASNMKSVYF